MLLSFDLDGVLMENPFAKGVFPEIRDKISRWHLSCKGRELSEDEIGELIREEFRRCWQQEAYRAYDWDRIISRVLDRLELNRTIDVVELVEKYCREPYIHRYPDGKKILDWLERFDIPLMVITNGFYRYQYPVLQALKLADYFSEIITSDIARAAKPEPASFPVPEERKEGWYHIGDSLLMDVAGAGNLGARTVYVNRELPENFRKLSPEERPGTERGRSFIRKMLKEEKRRYQIGDRQEPVKPDYAVFSLLELQDILAGEHYLEREF